MLTNRYFCAISAQKVYIDFRSTWRHLGVVKDQTTVRNDIKQAWIGIWKEYLKVSEVEVSKIVVSNAFYLSMIYTCRLVNGGWVG